MAQRQRIDYISLMNRSLASRTFIDNIILPTEDGGTSLSIIFRLDNNFLPFKKISPTDELDAPKDAGFFTIARLNAEIFEGRVDTERRNRSHSETDIAARDFWIDTLYTQTFDQTQSNKLYASGSLTSELEPGDYNYVLQLSLMENTNERSSERRNVRIQPWEDRNRGTVYLTHPPKEMNGNTQIQLLNLAENVPFAKDFYALIHLPKYDSGKEYSVNVYQANLTRRDTTQGVSIFEKVLESGDIIQNKIPTMISGSNPTLTMVDSDLDMTFALVKIPNSGFENSTFMLDVEVAGSSRPIAHKFFRSYWPDMPASLLNLDIAIDHLKYMISEGELKAMKSGSDREKEKKFREFWEKRDPTKGTVYNELMAEYYRRIDYAFKEFGTAEDLMGQDSDQGKVYISYGPPDSKDRQFPTNGNVREIWTYGDKKFIFENKTEAGFANFVLIATE